MNQALLLLSSRIGFILSASCSKEFEQNISNFTKICMYDISPTNVSMYVVILLKYDETSPVYY